MALEQLVDAHERTVGVECAIPVRRDYDHIASRDPHPLARCVANGNRSPGATTSTFAVPLASLRSRRL
jgi:hypothetical protein